MRTPYRIIPFVDYGEKLPWILGEESCLDSWPEGGGESGRGDNGMKQDMRRLHLGLEEHPERG